MSEPEKAKKIEQLESWQAEAHPSAKLVARESLSALDRQLRHLDSVDTKGSYLAAANVVVMGAFLASLATHPVHSERLQDLVGTALLFGLLGLAASIFTWWPRTAGAPPNPRGLRERYFNAREVDALQEISDSVVIAFDKNKGIENTKLVGIRFASVFLGVSVLLSVVALFVIFVLGRT